MKDRQCIELLQWALPLMRMRWAGFRKVRGQVCKRISRRIDALGLPDAAAYRAYLESYTDEWTTLTSLCRVTISRFYRDRGVFDHLGDVILPRLAERKAADATCWSVGCASGEEAYTMQIIWRLRAARSKRDALLRVVGTDSDVQMLERARAAVYPASALKDLPRDLADAAFGRSADMFDLRPEFKTDVRFEERDIRESIPDGPFDIILCRNLVFTYFEENLQQEVLQKLLERLRRGGILVTGVHESLPPGEFGLRPAAPAIYRSS